jgi:hypothetical protein
MAYDNNEKTSNEKQLQGKKPDPEEVLNHLLQKLYKWLRQVSNISWPLGILASLASLAVSFFGAKIYIETERVPVNVVSVFNQIMPALFFNITLVTILFVIILMYPVFMLMYNQRDDAVDSSRIVGLSRIHQVIIKSKLAIPPLILFVSNSVELLSVYNLAESDITHILVLFLIIFPIILVAGYFLIFNRRYKSISQLSPEPVSYAIIYQVALWLFWLRIASLAIDNEKNTIIFLSILLIVLFFLHSLVGFFYNKKLLYYVLLLCAILLVIISVLLGRGTLIERLAKNLLEVRAPDGGLCVMLYRENKLDRSCDEIRRDNLLNNSLNSYKIGGSDRLRIPLEANGIFYVRQYTETVKGQGAKSMPNVYSVSDIHLVPVSDAKLICGCEEPIYQQSTASIPPQPAASTPQPTTSEPKSAASIQQPAGAAR